MGKYGLLGEKLGHSYSPEIHALLKGYEYKLYEVPNEDVGRFLNETDLSGMNVTIPYKKTVMDYCVSLSDIAKRMGAVNTLVKEKDGWHGYNTDYYGFSELVNVSGIEVRGKKALVFGSGGASNTVCRVLEDKGASEIRVISRTGEDNYGNLHKHKDARILVNTTPVGMYPKNGEAAFKVSDFPLCEGVLDVIYNPARTKVMMEAEELQIPCAGGLYMLTAQAKRSAELFTGTAIDDALIGSITKKLENDMKNIILIGMPGSGKSAIGRTLGRMTGRRLIEIDAEIEKTAGKDIPSIFAESGEEGFRKIETEVMRDLCRLSGCIISTGGGCVTRQENYPLLHQNGRIFWIKRDLKLLAKKGRPISLKTPAEQIYADRKDKYEAFADVVIDNDSTVNAAAERILDKLKSIHSGKIS